MSNLVDMEYAKETCKMGHGKECCRYLGAGPNGMTCLKHDPAIAAHIAIRIMKGTMNAQGDNCEGKK